MKTTGVDKKGYSPKKHRWSRSIFMLGFILIVAQSLGLSAAFAKARPSYVSARAYWHLLKANLAWHEGDLSTAGESFRVALIYDPGNRLVRARLTEFLWRTQSHYSEKNLRRQQRRLRKDPRIYRLLGLEKWSRGQIESASKYFRAALSQLSQTQPEFRYVLVRDYVLFLNTTGRRQAALRAAKKIRDWELRAELISRLEGFCDFGTKRDDGEHICTGAVSSDVKALQPTKEGSSQHWLAPIQNPNDYVQSTQACLKSRKNCRALRNHLKKLVHPLPLLQEFVYQ
ncbi:MAG: hypothetical protein VYC39_17710 [Myxococcota bacterium]|nr:hypothetical protein [Myxococcota bacterium]